MPELSSPFYYYHSSFDAEEVIRRYENPDKPHSPAHTTNYLGVLIDPKYCPAALAGREGFIEGPPIPANWHADIAEWAAALRAVDLAGPNTFTMAELGCGWGCWMNITGKAAKSRGLKLRLIGVEGDTGHCEFAKESLTLNEFSPEEYQIINAVATSEKGVALFPKQDVPGVTYGLEPVFGASPEQIEAARISQSHELVPMIPMSELFADSAVVDLLHIDIQGSESALVKATLPTLTEKVAYLLIGTHSREIEGELFTTLLESGWILEVERPAMLQNPIGARPIVVVDGVQGWRNPKIR